MFTGPIIKWGVRNSAIVALFAGAFALSGCSDGSFDPSTRIGPSPGLPESQQYLFPPMRVASVVGCKNGEMPSVAQGLKIEALATGLEHPRFLYVLPNGELLNLKPPA
jgi:glucose/arabinose dehydrogenase